MRVGKLAGGAIAAATMIGMAAPAEAQRRHDDRPRHRHQKDKFDVGDAIVGGLIVGGILALVSSGKKKAREAEQVEDVPPPEMRVPIDMTPPAEPGAPIAGTPAPYSAEFDGLYDEDAATDRCAVEAESLGERHARLARVSSVTSTVWNGRSWVIKGQVELSDGYRSTEKQSRRFRCALKRGAGPVVTIEGLGPE